MLELIKGSRSSLVMNVALASVGEECVFFSKCEACTEKLQTSLCKLSTGCQWMKSISGCGVSMCVYRLCDHVCEKSLFRSIYFRMIASSC